MNKRIATTFGSLLLVANLAIGSDKLSINPTVDLKTRENTTRISFSKDIRPINIFGFVNVSKNPTYSEIRGSVSLDKLTNIRNELVNHYLKRISLAAEYNGDLNDNHLMRFGLTYKPDFGKNNFTQIKYLLISKKGSQASLLTSQQITKGISLSLLVDYNFRDNSKYFEVEASKRLTKNTSFIGRLIGVKNSQINKQNYFAGIKYTLSRR